jgi:signal transduction histidine kinase
MRDRGERTPEDDEQLAVIARNGEQLIELIDEVLAVAQIESGRLALSRADFDLGEVVRQLVDGISESAEDKGLEFVVDLAEDLRIAVHGDEVKLRQVLRHLLKNAVTFSSSGSVSLRVANRDRRTYFAVEDTGKGIPAEEIERLFIAFEAASRRARRGEGAGLGLAISQSYVRLMGGEIRVTSRPGEGSLFEFELDLSRPVG